MRYTVVWSLAAEMELAELWRLADDRAALSAAANTIDSTLRDDAHDRGESRPNGIRIYHEAPLGVLFQVDQTDRRVSVIDVWRFETRS